VAASTAAAPPTRPGLPPGPPLPKLAQTLAFLLVPDRFIGFCQRRYGGMVTLRTAFDPGFVMLFDPGLAKEVFRAPPDRLRAGEANALLGAVLGERSVLLLDGAEHLRHRRLLLPPFHGERMRAYEAAMVRATDRAIDAWPAGEEIRLLPATQALTLEVIMRAVFGVEEGPREAELRARIRATIEPVGRRLGILVLALSGGRWGDRGEMARFQQRRTAMDELIYAEIDRRRAAPDLAARPDVLSLLLSARDEDGNGLTEPELRDELVTLLVAGHETTATGAAWMFDLVLRSDRVLAACRRAVAEGDDRYLDAVVKEALRIRPVIPGVGRVVRGGPFELGGYEIPEGVEINPSIARLHRRAAEYPSPAEFRPERFLADDPPDTYEWIPFGGGTRRCLGASFAMFEMRVVLKRVLSRCELEPVGPRADTVERRGITLVPKNGVRVVQTRPPVPAEASAGTAA
jgi:cytochrome P450